MNRRSFLGLLGAAPIAALAPPAGIRPENFTGLAPAYHATLGSVVDQFACYGSVAVYRAREICALLNQQNELLEEMLWRENA